MTAPTRERGTCPVCGASTLVRADGKLRRHKRHPKGTPRLMVVCDGSELAGAVAK